MTTYKVRIQEIVEKTYLIDAENEEDAKQKANDGDYLDYLGESDHISSDIKTATVSKCK